MDLGAIGSKFTWRGPLHPGYDRIFERLDCALCSDCWRMEFPDAIVRVLPRVDFSDHHPILISLQGMTCHFVNKPFKFESAWMTHGSFFDTVKHAWDDGKPLSVNIVNTEEVLKRWNIDTFGSVKI